MSLGYNMGKPSGEVSLPFGGGLALDDLDCHLYDCSDSGKDFNNRFDCFEFRGLFLLLAHCLPPFHVLSIPRIYVYVKENF